MKHALVVGATGVIGNGIARQLIDSGQWHVTCATRSGQGIAGGEAVAVDLSNGSDVNRVASSLAPVTHLFYAAYQQAPTKSEEIEPNRIMLDNAISLAQGTGNRLEHVTLVTGGKVYGLQWGAISTPARENSAKSLGPNFYFAQQDLLHQRSVSEGWTWTELIPPFVTGLSWQSPMNLIMVLAVLGTLSRQAGMPLRFPGPATSWTSLHHLADAQIIGAAAAWAAEAASAANQQFNVANSDPGRWKHVWPVIAAYFECAAGDPAPVPLSQIADANANVWADLARRHQLKQPDIKRLVNWQWADYMFNQAFANDVLFETGKIRRAGFLDCLETEAVLKQRFDQLRALRIIP